MNLFLKIFDRCGQPIFILLAFLTLPLWFPLLCAWVVIDPPYAWAMWRKREVNLSKNPNHPPPLFPMRITAETSHSQKEAVSANITTGRMG
jgi:hypothetical protein